ncbi:MAG: zinc-binding dehydrogenase [Eubacterium sp.]
MKAYVIHEAGGPEKLKLEDYPVPEIKEGWSRVKVQGFGVNHSEIFTRKGLSPSVHFPRVLGIECTGILDASSDPERLPEGSRVISIMGEMGRAFDGSYEEYVLLPNDQIYPVKTGLSDEELAAVPETYYTAWGSLKNLKIDPQDSVLIRSAASGVGIAAAKLLKAAYPEIQLVGSTRHADRAELLKQAGCDEAVIDQDGKLQTDKSYDKVLELIGPATLRDTFSHVREGGIVCSTGELGGVWNIDLEPIQDLPANGYLTSFYSGNVSSEKLNEMLAFIESHKVNVRPDRIFSFEEVPDAHRWLESRHGHGKAVVLL